jgi:hypothetical protein
VRLVRAPVHEHVDVGPDQPRRGQQDEHSDEKRCERVGLAVSARHEGEADQHSDRAGEVAAKMERVRLERRAPVAARGPPGDQCAARVDRDHDPDHQEGVPGGVDLALVRAGEVGDRLVRDEEAREYQDRRLGEGGKVLCFPVAVRVAGVSGPPGNAEREKRQQRRDEIRPRMDRLGDEAQAAAGQAGAELQSDQHERRDYGDEGGSALRRHCRLRSADRAAFNPHMPCTPPPGGVADEHR